MGQQIKKVIKRRRRKDYLRRKNEQAKLGGSVKKASIVKKAPAASAEKAEKKAPAKKAAKKAPAKKAAKVVEAAVEATPEAPDAESSDLPSEWRSLFCVCFDGLARYRFFLTLVVCARDRTGCLRGIVSERGHLPGASGSIGQ